MLHWPSSGLAKSGTGLNRSLPSTNVFVRDSDIADHARLDSRRLEVVADGLNLWRGVQLAFNTTPVSPPGMGQLAAGRTSPTEQCWRRLASGTSGDVPRTHR